MIKWGSNEEIDEATIIGVLLKAFSQMFEKSPDSQYNFNDLIDRALFTSITYQEGKTLRSNNYLRREFSLKRIQKCIEAISIVPNQEEPALSKVKIDPYTALEIECFKAFNFHMVISAPQMKMIEHRGEEIVSKLFDVFSEKTELLPTDIQEKLNITIGNVTGTGKKSEIWREPDQIKARAVSDYVSGMTDSYAMDIYQQLTSGNQHNAFGLGSYL